MEPMSSSTIRDREPGAIRGSRRARLQHRRDVRRRNVTIVAVIGFVVVVGGVGLISIALDGGSSSTPEPVDLHLKLGDYSISGELSVPAGDVRIEATNVGVVPHNVGIRRGPISGTLQSGKSLQLDLGNLAPGEYELYCDIPGHVALGMVAQLHVTEPVPA
jgi:Cupredoxin-like domain